MAQISLYIEDDMVEKLTLAAKVRNCSVSKFVSALINEQLVEEDAVEKRKQHILCELKGSIDDPTFVEPPDISWETEVSRKCELI